LFRVSRELDLCEYNEKKEVFLKENRKPKESYGKRLKRLWRKWWSKYPESAFIANRHKLAAFWSDRTYWTDTVPLLATSVIFPTATECAVMTLTSLNLLG
jgi:hypothetical protein